jgi:hypothetical protein
MPRLKATKNWPVRKTMCASCPFRADGDRELAGQVLERTLFQASQICHHPRLHGKREHELCRGQRQEQLTLLYRMGIIDAPTDEAFNRKSKQLYASQPSTT